MDADSLIVVSADNGLDFLLDKEYKSCNHNQMVKLEKNDLAQKYGWLEHVLRHDNLLHNITEWKMLGKATRGRKRMELLHDMMEGRDYGQFKDLNSDRSRWRQDSK